jgi:tRNA G18 (ribose-2'-O)-methylase SpoU
MCLLTGPLELKKSENLIDIDLNSTCLLLDRLTDVNNVGTIIRSAYFLGIDAIFIEQQNMYGPFVCSMILPHNLKLII